MQRKILASVVANRFTGVQSCHGIGKSYIAARTATWWIAGHPIGEAKVVTSAPSGDQLKIVWGEIGKAHLRGGLPGTINKAPEWVIGEERVAFGRKPPDRVNADIARTFFQGIHARYLLVILDEACGIPPWLWQAALSLVTNEGGRVLAIGNPDDPTTEFAKKCAPGSGYHVISVSAFDTPNFTGEQVPEQLRESLVGPTYVKDAERDWGLDSPLYVSKVLGKFPETADDVLISPRLVREAHERDLSGQAIRADRRLGMDVARYGKDETCIYERRGGMIRLIDAWRNLDTTESARRAEQYLNDFIDIQIDVVGLGAGVVDPLSHAGYRVISFSGGEAATNPQRFVNRNSEAWWAFREGLEAGLIDLDPADEVLAAQLQSRRWKEDASGRRIEVERKEAMLKRGVKSPDRADAAVLAWYEGYHVPPGANMLPSAEEREPADDLLTMKF